MATAITNKHKFFFCRANYLSPQGILTISGSNMMPGNIQLLMLLISSIAALNASSCFASPSRSKIAAILIFDGRAVQDRKTVKQVMETIKIRHAPHSMAFLLNSPMELWLYYMWFRERPKMLRKGLMYISESNLEILRRISIYNMIVHRQKYYEHNNIVDCTNCKTNLGKVISISSLNFISKCNLSFTRTGFIS